MSYRITSACDGCTACRRQCPVHAIRGAQGEAHIVDEALCIDCGVCGHICARSAVRDENGTMATRIPRDERPRPVVDTDLCNGCALCVAFCPADARAVNGPHFQGASYLAKPQQCLACGECGRICLKHAIQHVRVDIRRYDAQAEAARLAETLKETT